MFFDKILGALKVENLFPKESSEELPNTSAFMATEPEPEPEPEPRHYTAHSGILTSKNVDTPTEIPTAINTSSLKPFSDHILPNFLDNYIFDAARLVIENEKGSIGMLQRHFKFGFNRAAHIMDQLEELGIVGPEEGTAPRRVLMSAEQFACFIDEFDMSSKNPKYNNMPNEPQSNTKYNIETEKETVFAHLNIVPDFSNDGALLPNICTTIICSCPESEQHKIIDTLLTSNSSKTLNLIIYEENSFNYTNYNALQQMLIPVVSDSTKFMYIIDYLKAEMTDRLRRFADFQTKDLYSYNKKSVDTMPTIIFIISELYWVKNYFEDNSSIIQLLLNGNRAGIHLLMFSQFDAMRFSFGIMQDLIQIYSPQQAYQMVSPVANDGLFIDTSDNIDDIDNIDGHDFEYFCADILRKNGFSDVEVTQGSGDHGIDITAIKDEISYAIQCKCYSSNIGNAAVQQAHTGKSLYHKDIAVVLTNQYFTAQAKEEADVLGVKLWDRDKLQELVNNSQ